MGPLAAGASKPSGPGVERISIQPGLWLLGGRVWHSIRSRLFAGRQKEVCKLAGLSASVGAATSL